MCQYICICDRGGHVYRTSRYVKPPSQDTLFKKADLPPRRVTNTIKYLVFYGSSDSNCCSGKIFSFNPVLGRLFLAMAIKPRILNQTSNVFKQTIYDIRRFLSTLQSNNITFCIILPLIGLCWSFFQSLSHQTFVLGGVLYIISGVGITAGKYDCAPSFYLEGYEVNLMMSNKNRLPPSLVTSIIYCLAHLKLLSSTCWRKQCSGLNIELVSNASCPPPLCGYSKRPIQCEQGPMVVSHGMANIQT